MVITLHSVQYICQRWSVVPLQKSDRTIISVTRLKIFENFHVKPIVSELKAALVHLVNLVH